MDDVSDLRDEGTEQPVDFTDDLETLAGVEAELSGAEAELEALAERSVDPRSDPAS